MRERIYETVEKREKIGREAKRDITEIERKTYGERNREMQTEKHRNRGIERGMERGYSVRKRETEARRYLK